LIHGHKWFYDVANQLILEAGLARAEQRLLHQSALPNIEAVESAYRAAKSFYVEAYK
jgi:hypothetical protein